MNNKRFFKIIRQTKETYIFIYLNLDGNAKKKIVTNIKFFNHMLEQLILNSMIDLFIYIKGDIYIDFHHSIEDIGITLGKILNKILYHKKGINRYGYSYIPLDESLTRVVIDISGRSNLIYNVKFNNNFINNFDLSLIKEFFIAFVNNANLTLHIDNLKGNNSHHQCETIFKAFGKALKKAIKINKKNKNKYYSTKGIL